MRNIFVEKTEKFTTDCINILLRTPLKKEYATKNALLCEVLQKGCKKYPSRRKLLSALDGIYGAVISCGIVKKGGEQIISFCAEALNAEGGKYTARLINLLYDVIYEPNAQNGAFDEETVETEKYALKRKLLSQKDNKRAYAAQRATLGLFEGSEQGVNADGDYDDVDEITPQNLYAHYNAVLSEGAVDVTICAKKISDDIEKALRRFEGEHKAFSFPSPPKINLPKKEFIKTNASQARLCAAFAVTQAPKTIEQTVGLTLFNEITGAGGGSRLFSQVRENEGKCYYITSAMDTLALCFTVEAGIEESDFEKTAEAIEKAVKDVGRNSVTDEELQTAKKSLLSQYRLFDDSPFAIMDFKINEVFRGTNCNIEDFKKAINDASADTASNAAKALSLPYYCLICQNGGDEN